MNPPSTSTPSSLALLADSPPRMMDGAAMDYFLMEMVHTLRDSARVAEARAKKVEQEMIESGLIPAPPPAPLTLKAKKDARESTGSLASQATGAAGKSPADEEEEPVRSRLEAIGLHVGANITERLCHDRSVFTDTLDTIKFICKDLWAVCWDKQVDNLRTNHRGVYVLQDNTFKPIARVSSFEGRADATRRAKLVESNSESEPSRPLTHVLPVCRTTRGDYPRISIAAGPPGCDNPRSELTSMCVLFKSNFRKAHDESLFALLPATHAVELTIKPCTHRRQRSIYGGVRYATVDTDIFNRAADLASPCLRLRDSIPSYHNVRPYSTRRNLLMYDVNLSSCLLNHKGTRCEAQMFSRDGRSRQSASSSMTTSKIEIDPDASRNGPTRQHPGISSYTSSVEESENTLLSVSYRARPDNDIPLSLTVTVTLLLSGARSEQKEPLWPSYETLTERSVLDSPEKGSVGGEGTAGRPVVQHEASTERRLLQHPRLPYPRGASSHPLEPPVRASYVHRQNRTLRQAPAELDRILDGKTGGSPGGDNKGQQLSGAGLTRRLKRMSEGGNAMINDKSARAILGNRRHPYPQASEMKEWRLFLACDGKSRLWAGPAVGSGDVDASDSKEHFSVLLYGALDQQTWALLQQKARTIRLKEALKTDLSSLPSVLSRVRHEIRHTIQGVLHRPQSAAVEIGTDHSTNGRRFLQFPEKACDGLYQPDATR
ncbi:hypothetical protein EVG20_g1613 [Dentipellis fragilis]|uniref:Trafficking protein particle complex subunit 6B n=1 Tax=Dentipellis fragilis TaxID=205917 RepID=A0A4Y9Z9F3_9AGAM|nr:hypothetical protein EVG20_g1613 [Dentipellis fragilis]